LVKSVARFHTHAQQELDPTRAHDRPPTGELIDTLADMLGPWNAIDPLTWIEGCCDSRL
jgi:hypothetical protein